VSSSSVCVSCITPLELPATGGELLGFWEGGAVDADHGFAEVFADFGKFFGFFVEQHRFHDGAGAFGGVAALEDSAANEDGFGSELHHERGVGGGGDSSGGEIGNREFAGAVNFLNEVEGCLVIFCEDEEFIFAGVLDGADFAEDGAHVANRLDDVTGTGFAFGADHCGPLCATAEGFSKVAGSADEGDSEGVLVDVVGVVGGGENFAFVNEVNFEGFEDLGFDEMTDAALGHDGDGHCFFDAEDHFRVGHAGNSAIFADVGGDSFESHDGDGSGIFGDSGLFGVDNIHDDATFEHFSEADFFAPGFGGGDEGSVAVVIHFF
jgi:hypothetical protein